MRFYGLLQSAFLGKAFATKVAVVGPIYATMYVVLQSAFSGKSFATQFAVLGQFMQLYVLLQSALSGTDFATWFTVVGYCGLPVTFWHDNQIPCIIYKRQVLQSQDRFNSKQLDEMMEHWKDCKCLKLNCMTGNCKKIHATFNHAILCLGFCFILQVFYPVIELFCIGLILQFKYPAFMYIMEFDCHAKEMTGNPQQCIDTILGFAKPAFIRLGKSVLQQKVLESSEIRHH